MTHASLTSSPRTRRALRGAALLMGALFLPLGASPVAGQDLPDADALIAAYVEALGGADRFVGASSVSRGTLSVPSAGLEGTMTLWQMAPDRMRMDSEIPGLGTTQAGYDGEHGWSVNPMMGAQLMSGAELEQAREQGSVMASLRDPSMVPGRETVGEAEFEGEACWRVQLTWASGRESHDCYSKETGLLVATESTVATPMGDIPSVAIMQEYREFDGRMVATRLIQRTMGMDQILVIESVEFTNVTEADIAPPEAIQALISG
jgi:hypothetical protein